MPQRSYKMTLQMYGKCIVGFGDVLVDLLQHQISGQQVWHLDSLPSLGRNQSNRGTMHVTGGRPSCRIRSAGKEARGEQNLFLERGCCQTSTHCLLSVPGN